MLKKITLFSLFLVFIFAASALTETSDTLTISTYYPSPYGVYNRLQTNSLGVGDNNGNGTLDSEDVPPVVSGAANGDVWIAGKVGIGIGSTTPAASLDVAGNVKIRNGAGDKKVLTSDAGGLATWQDPAGVPSGSLCGMASSTAQDWVIRCKGEDPRVRCPDGYTQSGGQRVQIDSIVQVRLYTCYKD